MPRGLLITLLSLLVGAGWGGPSRAADPPADHAEPLILVHYMPWYESRAFSGAWGWHWTMNHFQPDRVQPDGRREIASHLTPAIGAYDSLDPTVLEYQTLLMKVAGIDGAIIDWYGSEAYNDYEGINRRTLALIATLKRRGLKFAICYEDRIIRAIADREQLTPDQATAHAATHLRYCQENWFKDPAYVTWDGKPLLMVFGPEYLKAPQWATLLQGLQPAPAFFTLHERRDPAIGSFSWPPMWASREGRLSLPDLDAYLDRFEGQTTPRIPCAFPGFHDIYAEAGVQPSHGFLDSGDGATFRHTLDRALKAKSPVVQIATWNDYGEATCIEPSREFGTRYLAMIQDARRGPQRRHSPYSATDLKLPTQILELRNRRGPEAPDPQAIDEAVSLLDRGEGSRAAILVDRLSKRGAALATP